MKFNYGRQVYGYGAIAYGVITLIWRQINSLGNISHPEILVYIAGTVELIGGLTIQWERTKKLGAIITGGVFFIFTLYLLPPIFKMPLVYFPWGNFFEELSIALGGVFVFTSTIRSDSERTAKLAGIVYICYGVCVVSYSLYQLFYLPYTASLVPKWIPPGQMFWAITTTIAFALAAVSIISKRSALLASRLLTAMFLGFCFLVWLPLCIANPHNLTYWISNATTLAVSGTAWIVVDFLSQRKIPSQVLPFGRVPIEEKEN